MTGASFLDRVLDIASAHERIMVVGRTDAGKSTLVNNMADHMDAHVLDADIGQNDIGPPSAVWLGDRADGRYRAIDGYFCGSTSPSGHFLQMIAGTCRLARACGKRRVLINTTGLATGEIGRALKTEKVNAVMPDLIIGLEAGDELRYLDAFARGGTDVVRFRPHPGVTSRSMAERERIRAAKFREHFLGAFTATRRLDAIGVERSLLCNGIPEDVALLPDAREAGVVHAEVSGGEALVVFQAGPGHLGQIASSLGVATMYYCSVADFCGLLVGLAGPRGSLLGLGIVGAIRFDRGEVEIFSPVAAFNVLQFGSVKLDACSYGSAGPFRLQLYRHKH